LRRWRRSLAILCVAAILLTLLARARGQESLGLTAMDLGDLPLAGHHSLLVLAPHCDDEALGAAGLILAAERLGMDVHVVIATNGDGSLSSTVRKGARSLHHTEFIRMGLVRQQESLHALQRLGVPAEHVYFLGYPDRGLSALWTDYWSRSKPYRATFNGATRSPYPNTYNPQAVYAGEDLLADLVSILRTSRPDIVVYPHPNDAHPDHWSLGAFTRLALALLWHDDATYTPDAYAYLVHRAGFPAPKGLRPGDALLPPPALYNLSGPWYRVDLSWDDIHTKLLALHDYTSQLPFLKGFLDSFVRRNELLSRVQAATLPILSAGDALDPTTWCDAAGCSVDPVQRDPVRNVTMPGAIEATDLVALYAGERTDGSLVVCARVWGNVERPIVYVLHVTAVGSQGVVQYASRWGNLPTIPHHALAAGHYVSDQIPLSKLGDPWLIMVSAEVKGLEVGTLDRTAWQLLLVQPPAQLVNEAMP
jgi:LmbE family N-acetylglucosaminyl deacetylase